MKSRRLQIGAVAEEAVGFRHHIDSVFVRSCLWPNIPELERKPFEAKLANFVCPKSCGKLLSASFGLFPRLIETIAESSLKQEFLLIVVAENRLANCIAGADAVEHFLKCAYLLELLVQHMHVAPHACWCRRNMQLAPRL
jgi:hypothetical protein